MCLGVCVSYIVPLYPLCLTLTMFYFNKLRNLKLLNFLKIKLRLNTNKSQSKLVLFIAWNIIVLQLKYTIRQAM
jgi:hypothetical protein